MLDIYRKYCEGPDAKARFLTVYIEEAHASDRWFFPAAKTKCIKHHTSTQERIQAAQAFINDFDIPFEVVVDTMRNEANFRYGLWPERLYIIVDGVVVYKGGPGPFEYRLDQVMSWLDKKFQHA